MVLISRNVGGFFSLFTSLSFSFSLLSLLPLLLFFFSFLFSSFFSVILPLFFLPFFLLPFLSSLLSVCLSQRIFCFFFLCPTKKKSQDILDGLQLHKENNRHNNYHTVREEKRHSGYICLPIDAVPFLFKWKLQELCRWVL